MAEAHPPAQLDQPGVLGICCGVGRNPLPPGRAPQQGHVAGRLGRRGQQQPLRLGLQRPELPEKAGLDAAGQRPRVGQPETARQLGPAQPPGQLQQRQRVAAGLGDDPVADLGVQPPADRRGQQRARVGIPQPGNGQPGQAGQLIVVVRRARGEDHGDRLGQQPAGRERQALHRGLVEPLRVIDQAGQRLVLRRGGQQAQHRQPDQETIRSLPLPHPERDRQRVALRPRQLVQPSEHRHAQLVQSGERELHLRLDAPGPDHAKAQRPASRIIQQRRLADPGLAAHDQHGAAASPRPVQYPIHRRALAAPV